MSAVIFLDIDGVLAMVTPRGDKPEPVDINDVPADAAKLHPDRIENLNWIIDETNADVVISSTWRHFWSVADLQAMFAARGFEYEITDACPTRQMGANRDTVINWWVEENGEPDRFVAIDDDRDIAKLGKEHGVLVPRRDGLIESAAGMVIRKLRKQDE